MNLDYSFKGVSQLNISTGNFFRPEIQELFMSGSKSGYVKMIKGGKIEDWIIVVLKVGIVLVDPITVRNIH